MENKHQIPNPPFRIRNIRDQRFVIFWTTASFVISLLLTASITGISYWEYITGQPIMPRTIRDIINQPDPIPVWEVFGTDKITFILLGYDQVDEFAHRSDTLMVGAVDFIAKEVRILSIPRDTLVHIPRYGFMKVNSAYALGGDDLVRRTIEAFIRVDVDYVISVNYQGFIDIIDRLGGVDITVDRAMNYDDRRGDVHIHIEAGDHHFDGEEALNYARFRHDASGDFGRIERQQMLMKAVLEQAIRFRNLSHLQSIAGTLEENIHLSVNEDSPREPPDIGVNHVVSLLSFMSMLEEDDIQFVVVPTEDVTYEGLSCLRPIYSRTRGILNEVFTDDAPVAWPLQAPDGSDAEPGGSAVDPESGGDED